AVDWRRNAGYGRAPARLSLSAGGRALACRVDSGGLFGLRRPASPGVRMTTSELNDDPFAAHAHREPLPDAGIRVVLLTELSDEDAEGLLAPLLAQIDALGRPVERRIARLNGCGLGTAVDRSLADAHWPLVLVTTATEPWSKEHLDPLLEAIDHADHVVGRRPADRWQRGKQWLASLPRRLVFALPL